ncbi:penicillin-binding protein activator LpoB [Pseudomonas fluvialis]|uniref:penicillin-binding protein activator LpoB n=1 Tax=Pseudomonas fluvialis TaxID=1793966 RepID=UPI001FE3442F|nr:penicillin-binding protein activator LpoB [Pseudomonas pharmacofabricae]
MRYLLAILLVGVASLSQAAPKVAVTDLAYEERVNEYIRVVNAHQQAQATGFSASASASYQEFEGTYSYIDRGELRKFTGDIKGEILKSRMFQLIQGKPYTAKENEGLYDVISRIKQGHFQGADYVLFGTLSDIDFREDFNDIANTDSYSKVLGLTLVADFSLINTRTFEISSAFTAMGEAQDTKLVNGHDVRVTPNRGRVIREVSKSLGEDVAAQLQQQLIDQSQGLGQPATGQGQADQAPMILR